MTSIMTLVHKFKALHRREVDALDAHDVKHSRISNEQKQNDNKRKARKEKNKDD